MPAPPGAIYVPTTIATFTIAGTIEMFDTADFITDIRTHFPSAISVSVAVSPGSVVVVATIIFPSASDASAAATELSTSSPAQVESWLIQSSVTVESAPTAVSTFVQSGVPPPPIAPTPLSPSTGGLPPASIVLIAFISLLFAGCGVSGIIWRKRLMSLFQRSRTGIDLVERTTRPVQIDMSSRPKKAMSLHEATRQTLRPGASMRDELNERRAKAIQMVPENLRRDRGGNTA